MIALTTLRFTFSAAAGSGATTTAARTQARFNTQYSATWLQPKIVMQGRLDPQRLRWRDARRARLPHSIRLNGGFDTGRRSVQDRCFVVDSPQELLNCRVVTPFSAQTQFKANGVFPLKYDFMTSFAWQNVSGPSYGANYPLSCQHRPLRRSALHLDAALGPHHP